MKMTNIALMSCGEIIGRPSRHFPPDKNACKECTYPCINHAIEDGGCDSKYQVMMDNCGTKIYTQCVHPTPDHPSQPGMCATGADCGGPCQNGKGCRTGCNNKSTLRYHCVPDLGCAYFPQGGPGRSYEDLSDCLQNSPCAECQGKRFSDINQCSEHQVGDDCQTPHYVQREDKSFTQCTVDSEKGGCMGLHPCVVK